MEAHAYPDQLEIAKVDPTAVTVPAGAKVTADLAMTALYAPVITDFNPKTGQAGTTVTITGTNLAQDGLAAASVTFNGVPAPVSAASSVSLTVTVPAGASGPVRVKVDGVEALAATTYSEAVSILSLNAVHPEVARIGDTLYLEGDFNGSATVNFNGGVSAAATTLGSGRAKVVVPAGAKTGPPALSAAGLTSRALPVRVIGFTPGLQAFRKRYEQADGAREFPSLSGMARGPVLVNTGRYLYALGGSESGGSGSDVDYRAAAGSDGTLGRFDFVADRTLASLRWQAMAVRIGDFVYVLGGATETARESPPSGRTARSAPSRTGAH